MDNLIQHPYWEKVLKVIITLDQKGYKAWLTGGCVRDAFIGRIIKDFDVVTDAKPDDIENLFEKTISVGKAFGIVKVNIGGFIIDVATFRSDCNYKDGRHPENIKFSNPKEDALRRDFTINALFYDPLTSQLYDFVEGREDIEKKIIRTIGKPERRFNEDKLRLLRALRFASELGFQIEKETFSVLKENISNIKSVSSERIREEILKLLKGKFLFQSLDLVKESYILEVLFCRSPIKYKNWMSFKKWTSHYQPFNDPLLCLAALLLTLEINNSKELEKLFSFHCFSKREKKLISEVLALQFNLAQWEYLSKAEKRRLLAQKSMPLSLNLYSFFILLNPKCALLPVKDLAASCKPLPEAYLKGEDLIERGILGEQIGQWLAQGMDAQLEERICSRKEALEWLDQRLNSSERVTIK